MAGEIACASCGQLNSPDQRFCGRCGSSLSRICPSCGSDNPSSFAFCGTCGASLSAGTEASSKERRWATVLFGDLSGFTAMSERTDPEDVSALVDRGMNKLGEIVERFGGRVERVTGDEIMVVFGAPVAYEDDPERAVRTALEMQRFCAEHSEEFGGLPLRIGVNTGEVMFAPVGPADARRFTVMGDAVNVAARLQTAAPKGGVLVGEETQRASRRSIRFEQVEPVLAKGKEEPVHAWLAVEAHEPSARPLSEVPIVGRESELEMLRAIWKRVVDERRSHLVTVIGAPGVGKTRLTFEFVSGVSGVARQGHRVLSGRALPYGESSGYGAFAQQVKSAANVFETDTAEVAQGKLRALVTGVVDTDAREVAEHVAIAMGLAETATQAEKGPLFTSCRRLIEGLARQDSLLLVFEDIHWADATLLELIEFLATRLRDSPVLVLTLARPELHDTRRTWGTGLTAYTSVALAPLSDASALELAQHHLTRLPGTDHAGRLAAMAGGNPLFIEELAATVSEARVDDERLPTTIHGIIAARIDALPANARSALLDASVVGQIFWRGALMALGHGSADAALDALEQRDFIRRQSSSRFEGDQEISFKHMLIRDVAYATVAKAERRERHAKVASFLEDAARQRPRESASLLAHHWKEAGDVDRAVSYMELAAEGARGAGALGEAISLYDEALELIEDGARANHLRLARARAMVQRGDYRSGADELDDLLVSLEGAELADALVHRASTAFWLGDPETLRLIGPRVSALGEESDNSRLCALGIGYLSMADQMDGHLEIALRRSEEAIEGVGPSASIVERGMLLNQAGAMQYWVGNSEKALVYLEEAFSAGSAERYAEPALAGGANLALALFGLGRHREAEDVLRTVDRLAPELELVPRLQGRALNIWAGGMYDIGQGRLARELNERAMEMSGLASFPVVAAQARADLLFSLVSEGDIGSAESSLGPAREAASKVGGFHRWLLDVRLTQAEAEIALGAGRLDDALDSATLALDRKDGRRLKYVIAARLTVGSALMARGEPAEAAREFATCLEEAKALKYPRWIWRAAGALVEARTKAGDDQGAESAESERRRAIDDFAQQIDPDRRKDFLLWLGDKSRA